MARSVSDFSVATLERLLSSRKSKLTNLTKKRKVLAKKLRSLDSQIESLGGRTTNGDSGMKHRKGRKRPKNAVPLHEAVVEVLKKSKTGYPIGDLADKVIASGYKSNSSDFRNVLYQCLYKSKQIVHDEESGRYRVKG